MSEEETITNVPSGDLDDLNDEEELEAELTYLGKCEECDEAVYAEEGSHTIPGKRKGRTGQREPDKLYHPRCSKTRRDHDKAVQKSKRGYERRAREAARRSGAVRG